MSESRLRLGLDDLGRSHPRHANSKGSGWGKQWDTERSYEVLLNISWEQVEEDAFDPKFPTARSVTSGTTVRLTSDGYAWNLLSSEVEAQKPERDRMVRALLAAGHLRPPGQERGATEMAPVRIDVRKGVMKISGAGRLLHLRRGGRTSLGGG